MAGGHALRTRSDWMCEMASLIPIDLTLVPRRVPATMYLVPVCWSLIAIDGRVYYS